MFSFLSSQVYGYILFITSTAVLITWAVFFAVQFFNVQRNVRNAAGFMISLSLLGRDGVFAIYNLGIIERPNAIFWNRIFVLLLMICLCSYSIWALRRLTSSKPTITH